MKSTLQFLAIVGTILVLSSTAYGQWTCQYATQDDEVNGTSDQTASVAVLGENSFVALVHKYTLTGDTSLVNYLVGYINADCNTGRTETIPYAVDGTFTTWKSGSDAIPLNCACQIAGTVSDGFVYVANNDPDHNVLVFKSTATGIASTNYRMKTGTRKLWGIATDNSGMVYVCCETATGSKDVMVFNKVTTGTWATTHNDQPVYTINLPVGTYRGIAANETGKLLFVSDYWNRKILKYVRQASGYVQDATFSWSVAAKDTVEGTGVLDLPNKPVGQSYKAHPMGLAYLPVNNILFAGVGVFKYTSTTPFESPSRTLCYGFGKVALINPNDGKYAGTSSGDPLADSANIAWWNMQKSGSYSTRGTACDFAGYASPYDVDVDALGNLFVVSYWDWAVEKWGYFPMLPTIQLTVGVAAEGSPVSYLLNQNYPNPFNPQTYIDFSIQNSAHVQLTVTNALGQEVATILDRDLDAGKYTARFDAARLASGIYYYTLKATPKDGNAQTFTESKRMLVLK
jgi:hypothetical protein